MTSGIEFNKGYSSSYIMLPLSKYNGKFTVQCKSEDVDAKIDTKNMRNFDDLRKADSNKDGVISLNELKNCKDKTDFMKMVELAMEKFNSNSSRDYSKNLFEYWV